MVQLYYMRYIEKFQVWDKSFAKNFISYITLVISKLLLAVMPLTTQVTTRYLPR